MPAYSAQHYQDVAGLLAAERREHGASPALNRIITDFARMFAADNPPFSRALFGQAARGQVAPTAKKPARSDRSEEVPS